ncbi:MAG: DUF1648 domain-containing protein, partial [Armatimonadaceae bacterium]
MSLPLRLIGFGIATALCHALAWRPRLPLRLASHFDGAGNPDGWMGRDSSLLFYVGMVVFLGVLFGFLGPWIRRFPDSMVNLPDKEYWLAPERRDQTYRRISDSLAWLGVLCSVLIVALHEMTFRANLQTRPHLGSGSWILLMVFLVAELV